MAERVSIADARDSIAALIHRVEQEAPVELTRRGKPVAVIMCIQQYRQLKAERTGFWASYHAFRSRFDLQQLDMQPETWGELRDRTPGREVEL